MGPVFSLAVPWGVIPFPSVYSNLNLGILFVLAASSISVYSIMVSGWVSNSKYSIDAAVRAAALMISYEVAIELIILCVCIPTNSFNLSYIIAGQEGIWNVIPLFPMFVLFCVSALAEIHWRVLGEIAVCYDNVYIPHKGQGDAYILNYKTNARGFALIPKCKSGFVWWDYFASPHHAN